MNSKLTKAAIFLLSIGTAILGGCSSNRGTESQKKPNILLIMTDDQGYGDVGYHGNPYVRTPVIDSLAAAAARIDPFYVSPVCAPTRASLMTGRYHLRTGVYDTYNGGAMMAASEVTLAEVLSGNGYHTAMIGKWHLGDNYPLRAMDQGFQYVLAHKGGGIGQPGDDFGNFTRPDSSYFHPFLWENGTRVRRKGYCSDIFTEQAIAFIREHSERSPCQPFFLYLAFNAPHTPLQLPGPYAEEYADLEFDSADFERTGFNLQEMNERDLMDARRVYGMVSNIDDNLKRLVTAMEEMDLMEQTLVVFLTDNGPQQRRYTAGLSGRKGSVLEGGIRVPCFFHWQGNLEDRLITRPAAHIDIMPTLLEMAGIPSRGEMDGTSLVPLLKGEKSSPEERSLFFVWARGYPQRYTNMAVRKGDFKLAGFIEHGVPVDSLELYNLEVDPFERKPTGADHPAIKKELTAELDSWYREMLSSSHLLEPPRIMIGSEHEDPVILGRNDWKGPKVKRWASPDAYGYWDVEITDPGPYDVTLVFGDPFSRQGKAYVRAGIWQYWITHRDTVLHEITLQGVTFDPGKQMFEGWVESRGRIYAPICIEVAKQ